MYYILKHLSIRVWATIFLGGLISLWILPVFHPHIGLEWSLLPALVVMIVFYMAVGWFSNRFALSAIKRLIREAGKESVHTAELKRPLKKPLLFWIASSFPLLQEEKNPQNLQLDSLVFTSHVPIKIIPLKPL